MCYLKFAAATTAGARFAVVQVALLLFRLITFAGTCGASDKRDGVLVLLVSHILARICMCVGGGGAHGGKGWGARLS